MTSLQKVFDNKQRRGAFGQGRMEAIVADALPQGAYEFQFTLSNNSRPDCCIHMPDNRHLIIDAKFPLEATTALENAKTDDERLQATRQLRQHLGKHIDDISGKYLIKGETQDVAFMFIPSESMFAELYDALRRRLAEGLPRRRDHRVAVAADAGDPGGAADSEGRPHARGGRQDPAKKSRS